MKFGIWITKIHAAEIANENGIDMIIMNGRNPDHLYDLFDNQPIGTQFLAKQQTAAQE